MPNETDYQKKILDQVKDAGGFGWKLSSMMLVGIPDLVLIYNCRVAFVEVKLVKSVGETVNVSKLQTIVLDKIRAAGGAARLLVIHTTRLCNQYYVSADNFGRRPIDAGGFSNITNGKTFDLEGLM